MSFLAEVASVYRASKKKKDINFWTERVCRPPAAVIVAMIKDTRITPNQVTLAATALAMVSAGLFIGLPGWSGAIIAALVFELSFILDCVDGQLARVRQTASPLGHYLDFLMDEIKAYFIFGAVAIRLWRFETDPEAATRILLVTIAAMACLGAGLAMTTFTRRAEYGAKGPTAEGQPAEMKRRTGLGQLVSLLEWAARTVVHYPSYILLVALVPPGRLDLYFWAYAGVSVLYAGKTALGITWRMGRFSSG